MAKRGGASSVKRIANRLVAAGAAASGDEQHDSVLVEQFRRDLSMVLQPALEDSTLTSSTKQEVAYYGTEAEKIVQIEGRLMRLEQDQMSLTEKVELLLVFGDKLYQAREYRAASVFFYERVLQLLGAKPGQLFDTNTSDPVVTSSIMGQVYVRSAFGIGLCSIQTERRSDPYVHHVGTLERLLSALWVLQVGMETAVRLEKKHSGQFTWLILNGSLAVFSAAKPMAALGFPREVVGFLKWCLVALESSVMLSTTKYILWKLQLSTAICDCYQAMARKEPSHHETNSKSAVLCAERALAIVQRLRKEEELDLPLPVDVQLVLDRAQSTAMVLMMRAKAGASQDKPSKAVVESTFTKPDAQVRAAMDAMERITCAEKHPQSSRLYLSSYSKENEGPMVELLSVVIGAVRPFLEQLSSQGVEQATTEAEMTDSVGETSLRTILPLPFHLAAMSYCYCLGESQTQELRLLLSSILARAADPSEQVPEKDATAILCLASIFDALGGMRQSLLPADSDTQTESIKSKQARPIELATGRVIPSETSLIALVSALNKCVLADCDEFCLVNRDLLIAAALILWRDVASPVLESLESCDACQLPATLACLLSKALESIHLVFTATDFGDLLLHGQVALSFGALLITTKSPRLAAEIVRRVLERIDGYRDELALRQSFSKDMADSVDTTTPSGRSHSDATISFNIFSAVDQPSPHPIDGCSIAKNDDVGVPGTGALFGRLHQDLCCTQADLLLLLYRAELQDATVTNTLSPLGLSAERSSKDDNGPNKYFSETESRLLALCRQNGYMKTLLSIQRLYHPLMAIEDRVKIVDECFKSLRRMEVHERDLQRRVAKHLTATGPSTPEKAALKSSVVPVAPVVIARSSSAVTIQIVEFISSLPAQRKRPVHYYMVYAKLSGAGTAVSLNNNQLPGTAVPIYTEKGMTATISGLAPNESYVFAVAAFDDRCELIQGIGETSEPVIALNPLPLPLCYGYLAQACNELHLIDHATKAASYLYDLVVSAAHARRPTWRASPFYRQALQRETVLRLPVPILDKCAAAMEILCRDEAGDPELDGMLATRDPDGGSLLSMHVSVLESARRISIGVEIASAADNQAMVGRLCFIGYRVLLPLLHLASGCGGMAYPALMTFLQGLATVERDPWGQETRSLGARLGFELFRIVTQQLSRETLRATLPLLSSAQTIRESPQSPELLGLDEALLLHQLAQNGNFSGLTVNETPPQTTTLTPPAKNAPVASKTSGTPDQTPRTAEDGDVSEAAKLPPIREILKSVGYEALKVFKLVEMYARSDKRAIEVLCKISSAALETASLDEMEHLLSSVKVSGDVSKDFRALLTAVGGAPLLPEEAPPAVDNAFPATSTPVSARSESEADKAELKSGVDDFAPDAAASAAPDDMYLYHWCGELFFLKAIVTSRKITGLRSNTPPANVDHGPMTEDNIYNLLRSDAVRENPPSPADPRGAQASSAQVDGKILATLNEFETTTPRESSDHDRSVALVDQLLQQTAACGRLFHRGQCWQSLQAAAQHLWNTILCAWIPPSEIALSEACLAQLGYCADALLDMVELHTMATGYESLFASQSTSATSADEQAPASTMMVTSTMAKLRVQDVWLADFITYITQSFACVRSWERIVRMGERYFKCCGMTREGSRFAEINFPILIHAQTQIVQRQERSLVAAQAERQAFVAAFQEQEAKRKNKKSRLVVEEVATPEELAFRARDTEMEEIIQALTQTRDRERTELQHLTLLHEGLQKSRNKCQQALDNCHGLVSDYRCRASHQTADEELSTLRRQVISSFTRCVASCRQKRQKRLTCQALQDLGDFHLACGDTSEATKCWLEALDNAFSTLRVVDTWRQVVSPNFEDEKSINGDADAPKIAGDELWIALQSCGALGKLVLETGSSNAHQATERALMAAAIFTRLYACAMPHPTKPFLYGSYSVVGQLWPGRNLFLDSESVSPFTVVSALVCSQEILLQYEGEHAVAAMPMIAGYEYIALSCLDDRAHVANAMRLRITALTYAGRFQEAFAFLPQMLFQSSILVGKSEVPVFHGNRALQDPENVAAMSWLTSLSVSKLAVDLKERCRFHEPLIRQIVVAFLRLVVALAVLKAHSHAQGHAMNIFAQNMVKETLDFLTSSSGEQSNGQAHEQQHQATQPSHSDAWDEFELRQLRCDVLLHHGRLLFANGQWKAALELSVRGIDAFTGADVLLTQKSPSLSATASVDHELKYSPCTQSATLVTKCRRLGIACHIARGDIHAAIALADTAIREAQEAGEKLLCHELELQRTQAMVCLGKREEAGAALTRLGSRMVEQHAADRSALYVRVMHTLGAVVHEKAIFTADPELLNDVCRHLTTAKRELDRILRAEGWVGVAGSDDIEHGDRIDSSGSNNRDKFLNLYYPALPTFVQVSADLAQALAECPPDNEISQDRTKASGAHRGDRVLTLVRDALLVLDEIPHPRHMSATKAQLLLLQGATLKKKVLATFTVSGHADDGNESLRTLFTECVDALQLCIRVCITDGGHDRALIRRALVELIELYVNGCFQADKDEHVHAAFHFLRLAVRVCQQEATLFDSVELQLASEPLNTSNLTADQQLPAFITDAICSVASATPLNAGSTTEELPRPAASAPAPDTSKKVLAGANAASGARPFSSPFDPTHAINYFVRVLREQNVFPTGNAALQETALRLHCFLAQAHPAYAKNCCLTELPPVPPLAPEIQPGLVCAHWGQDITPGISFIDGARLQRSHVTLFFTLGTTKINMSEGETSADNGDAAFSRMERFVTTPLLSKRTSLSAAVIHEVRTAISRLRVNMEDEQSLIIDKAAFPTRLRLILRRLQLIFRKPNQTRVGDEADGSSTGDEVRDMFGNTILLPATLEMVRTLEDLLTISKAVSAAENTLCYFLRDLLD